MFVGSKAFQMFELKKENQVLGFIKRNPVLIALAIIIASGILIPEAHASGLSGLSKNLKDKLRDIKSVMEMAAGASAGIGFVWLVITFLRGEPNYRLGGSLLVGGALLAVSGQVVHWLAGI